MKELRMANVKQQKFQPELEGFLKRVEDRLFFFLQIIGELSGRKAGDILHSSKEKKQEYKLFESRNRVFNIVVFVVRTVTLEVFSDAH